MKKFLSLIALTALSLSAAPALSQDDQSQAGGAPGPGQPGYVPEAEIPSGVSGGEEPPMANQGGGPPPAADDASASEDAQDITINVQSAPQTRSDIRKAELASGQGGAFGDTTLRQEELAAILNDTAPQKKLRVRGPRVDYVDKDRGAMGATGVVISE